MKLSVSLVIPLLKQEILFLERLFEEMVLKMKKNEMMEILLILMAVAPHVK